MDQIKSSELKIPRLLEIILNGEFFKSSKEILKKDTDCYKLTNNFLRECKTYADYLQKNEYVDGYCESISEYFNYPTGIDEGNFNINYFCHDDKTMFIQMNEDKHIEITFGDQENYIKEFRYDNHGAKDGEIGCLSIVINNNKICAEFIKQPNKNFGRTLDDLGQIDITSKELLEKIENEFVTRKAKELKKCVDRTFVNNIIGNNKCRVSQDAITMLTMFHKLSKEYKHKIIDKYDEI